MVVVNSVFVVQLVSLIGLFSFALYYSNDRDWLRDICFSAAAWNGRLQLCSQKVADSALPPGMVLPNQLHGGPGRAGGGEELGGVRGMALYSNRVALQGDKAMLSKLLGTKL